MVIGVCQEMIAKSFGFEWFLMYRVAFQFMMIGFRLRSNILNTPGTLSWFVELEE